MSSKSWTLRMRKLAEFDNVFTLAESLERKRLF